jgi:hypothetical protein
MNFRSKIGRHLGLLTYIWSLCIAPLLAQNQLPGAENMKTENAKIIAQQLQRCPCWISVRAEEVERRKEITKVYLKLSAYDNETIRAGIALYLKEHPLSDPESFYASEKLFAFMRVIFKIPRHIFATREHFNTMGNPIREDGSVDLLWPFSMDDAGRLTLTGVDSGMHTGPPYDPLADFAMLASRFGRRSVEK